MCEWRVFCTGLFGKMHQTTRYHVTTQTGVFVLLLHWATIASPSANIPRPNGIGRGGFFADDVILAHRGWVRQDDLYNILARNMSFFSIFSSYLGKAT